MTFPTIHLNGTSAKTLLDGYLVAMNALNAAMKALDGTAPNGRDYYPQSQTACGDAMIEHSARYKKLMGIHDELNALAEHVSDRL